MLLFDSIEFRILPSKDTYTEINQSDLYAIFSISDHNVCGLNLTMINSKQGAFLIFDSRVINKFEVVTFGNLVV